METIASAEPAEPREQDRRALPLLGLLGMLVLIFSASLYGAYGIGAYPRQEWVLELVVALVFFLPALNFVRGRGSVRTAVRAIGVMLILHTFWDALHWPAHPLVQTPIDPRIPVYCPYLDIPLGILLLIRGR